MKVLIADDDPISRLILSEHLATHHVQVLVAHDGVEAMNLYGQHLPSICIIDWMMPKMDGLTLSKQIRSHDRGDATYVVMLTSRNRKEHLLEAFNGGVDDFLSKPVDPGELAARLKSGIRIMTLHRNLTERVEEISSLNQALLRVNEELDRMAALDGLTGLFNRRATLARFDELCRLSIRYKQPVACAMIDVDHFKRVNDSFGHAAGDDVLVDMARTLRASLRESDIIGRMGGEEFVVLLPNQTVTTSKPLLDRLRSNIADTPVPTCAGPIRFTISTGVSDSQQFGWDTKRMLAGADEALYRAKHGGRNRIEAALVQPKANPPTATDFSDQADLSAS